jgi:DNA mismatch repair protein MSH2
MSDEADFVEENEQNVIQLGVHITYGKAGREINCAIYNADSRKFSLTEFQDNEHFSNFESLLVQINPQNNHTKFVLLINLPTLTTEREKLIDIITLSDVEYEEKSTENFPTKSIENDISLLMKSPLHTYIKEARLTKALSSLMCIILHNKILQEKTNIKQFTMESYTLTKFMKLDLAAINALSIFPKTSAYQTSMWQEDNSTLTGLLNKCKTQIGARCLKRWLKQPLQDIPEINKRLDIVECLVADRNLLLHVQNDFLRKIPDLDKLYAKFYKVHSKKKHSGNLVDCMKVYQVVTSLKTFVDYLNKYMADEENANNEALRKYYLEELKINLGDFEKFEDMIEQSIDMDKAKTGEYLITASFSQKLTEINTKVNKTLGQMENLRKEVEEDLGNCDVKLVDHNTLTFVFEVNKKEGDDAFRQTNKKYKTISVKQRTLTFVNSDLSELVADYNDQKSEYKTEQSQVVGKILEVVATYYPAMEKASSLIAEMDCLCAFAHVAANAPHPYVRPKIVKGGNIILKDSRHPCLALIDANRCIANDCEMFKGKSIVHIITGPNMGGKSTYIRQVAICALLAHIGCFVPCSSAEVPLIDALITRVGASDMQLKGLSTFMSEMLETSCLLKIATENSLLVIDELGRGTSTSEGFGISWGVSEYILKHIKAYCLFATHFHELTTMEGQIPGVKNFYVSAVSKDGALTMQYKVKQGAVDRSYGIYVAEMLKFPAQILKDGKQKAKELERFEEHDGAVDSMEEENVVGEAMELEGAKQDIIKLAKQATNSQKVKVLEMIPNALAEIKKCKTQTEKVNSLQALLAKVKTVIMNNQENEYMN